MEIRPAETEEDFAAAKRLFVEYAQSLGFSLCFQGFDREIERLPQMYGPPAGAILLAFEDGEAVGCVALRPAAGGACEMKRLFVSAGHRGSGLGRKLAEAVLDQGRRLGYRRMVLDTLPSMERARALYRSLGFEEARRARDVEGVGTILYMERAIEPLEAAAGRGA